jgi:molecular chaperone GrpE
MADVSDLIDPSGKPLSSDKHKEEHEEKHEPKEVEINIDYKDRYMRALADYKNLQRKIDEERKLIFTFATANVLEQIIPTVDLLYKAEVFIKDPGMQMVKDQLVHVLEEFGLKEIELLGKEYDPHMAEVVGTVEGEKENVVVEVVRRGYMLADKVIRVGQVKVGKEKADSSK